MELVCAVGRSNTGKLTLTNALVDQKVAITLDRSETTRRVVKAVVNRESSQLILVDTPGLHHPRMLLGERFNDIVRDSLSNVDAIVMCLPADEATGPGDHFFLSLVSKLVSKEASIVAAVTKSDPVDCAALVKRLQDISKLANFIEVVPVSAVKGDRVEFLASLFIGRMPESPPLYLRDAVTDESGEALIAEFVREAALKNLHDELSHSPAVTIDEIVGDRIHVSLHVERDSQKGIVIGQGGAQFRRIRVRAREIIERLLDRKANLDFHVKVTKD